MSTMAPVSCSCSHAFGFLDDCGLCHGFRRVGDFEYYRSVIDLAGIDCTVAHFIVGDNLCLHGGIVGWPFGDCILLFHTDFLD